MPSSAWHGDDRDLHSLPTRRSSDLGRLLSAEEVDVDLATESAAKHVGIGDEDAEPRLSHRGTGARYAGRVRISQDGDVTVVGARAIIETVHEHGAGELDRALDGRWWRRRRGGGCRLLCSE